MVALPLNHTAAPIVISDLHPHQMQRDMKKDTSKILNESKLFQFSVIKIEWYENC